MYRGKRLLSPELLRRETNRARHRPCQLSASDHQQPTESAIYERYYNTSLGPTSSHDDTGT